MILPRISTNVSVYDIESETDALAMFLESIDKYLSLPTDTLTCHHTANPFMSCTQNSSSALTAHQQLTTSEESLHP